MEVKSTDTTFPDNNSVEEISALLSGKSREEQIKEVEKPAETPKPVADPKPETELEFDSAARAENPLVDIPGDAPATPVPDEIPDDRVTLKQLAENLGVDKRELYDVAIPLSGTSSATLGELKDAYKESLEIKSGQADFETRKTHQENELMTARREIEQLVRIGNQNNLITPEVRAELARIHGANMTREHNSLLRVIPTWKDPTIRKAEFDEIVEVMSEWGFTREEIENAPEHRTMKFMFDMTQRIKRVRAAVSKREAEEKKDVPTNTGRGKRVVATKKGALKQRIDAAKSGGRKAQEALISELIN